MSQLLADSDRAYVLDQLRMAPDSVLADAMLAFNRIRDNVVAVRQMRGTEVIIPIHPTAPIEEVPAQRPNVNPGKPNITKIGSETKAELLRGVAMGAVPPNKYAEHMKLLWSRGEVKFDGKDYYL